MKYKVGDRVRIVDNWVLECNHATGGAMDKWLGKVMTIREVSERHKCYFMVEDQHDRIDGQCFGWYWYESAIAGLATFTKSDLKNGDIVLLRNDVVAIYIDNFKSFVCDDGRFCILEPYNNDLSIGDGSGCDIMKVIRPIDAGDCRLSIFKYSYKRPNVIYERKEPRKMTLAEVCAALGEEIIIVKEASS